MKRYSEIHYSAVGFGSPPPPDVIDLSNRHIVGVSLLAMGGVPDSEVPMVLSFGPIQHADGTPININPVQEGVDYAIVVDSVPEVVITVGQAGIPVPSGPMISLVRVVFEED